MSVDPLSRRAEHVFLPRRVMEQGPPWPWRKWNSDGAMLAWLRSCGFEADVFVNWIRARVTPNGVDLKMPYAAEPGYWLFYYGSPPTTKQIKRAMVN